MEKKLDEALLRLRLAIVPSEIGEQGAQTMMTNLLNSNGQ